MPVTTAGRATSKGIPGERSRGHALARHATLAAMTAALALSAGMPVLAAAGHHGHRSPHGVDTQPVTAQARRHRHKGRARTVTKTFANGATIGVPATGTVGFGAGDPYPSTLLVQGFSRSRITDVNLTLRGLTHPFPSDLDVLLVAPDGRNAVVLGAVGSGDDAVDVTLVSGTFRPLDTGVPGPEADLTAFPSPAPGLSGQSALSSFDGIDPNGEWQLFVIDDRDSDEGIVAGGWSLEITASSKATSKHHGKRKKRH
jgi:subtilisin-like proprotein convertase family protein